MGALGGEEGNEEETASAKPEEMTKNKNTNKKRGGEKDRARDQAQTQEREREQGLQHDRERERDEQDGKGASGNKQWVRGSEAKGNTHGRRNNYWVCIGGSVDGGKVFTDKEEARKAKEYQHC